jgi:pimeloyl-ACP methyl ester carboxylesterase
MTQNLIYPDKTGFIEEKENKIYWEYFGKGNKEVYCFLNGIAMYTKSWYQFTQLLSSEYDILLFDFLGQGESSHQDQPINVDDLCHFLTKILDHLKIDKIHLMGVSFGGMVGLSYSRLYQDRLYTLTTSGALLTEEVLYYAHLENSIRLVKEAPFDLFSAIFFEKIFSEDFSKKMLSKMKYTQDKLYERYNGRTYSLVRLFESQKSYLDDLLKNMADYQKVKTPNLVITGDQDLLVSPRVQEKICEILPNSRFELFDNTGHVVYMEKPVEFAKLMKKIAEAKSVKW